MFVAYKKMHITQKLYVDGRYIGSHWHWLRYYGWMKEIANPSGIRSCNRLKAKQDTVSAESIDINTVGHDLGEAMPAQFQLSW